MGAKLAWTGITFLVAACILRSLSNDDESKVPTLWKVFVIGLFINGLALAMAGILMQIWA